jgi:hypothetical protein
METLVIIYILKLNVETHKILKAEVERLKKGGPKDEVGGLVVDNAEEIITY